MTNLAFSQNLALALYSSKEQFPIDLDDAWQWLGYATKQKAEQKLKSSFEENTDFLTKRLKTSTNGRPRQCVMLSIDCFKSLGMMAGTEQGKAIRRYFLECERIAKQTATESSLTSRLLAQSRHLNQLTSLEDQAARLRDDIANHEKAIAQSREKLKAVESEIEDIYIEVYQPIKEKLEYYESKKAKRASMSA
ncbi:antA/AntB antirepressor family protein [Nostoc sp. UHCC 0702]|nr:antA/AntB antirepressor family protein [Nostoc sp. UHCC 0702]